MKRNKLFNIIRTITYFIFAFALSLSSLACTHQENISNHGNISYEAGISHNESISTVKEDGAYTSKDEVAAYINVYKKLPKNFITKAEARKLGWQVGGNNDLNKVAKGKSIGGDEYKNYERQLPIIDGRKYYECDIDYVSGKRNAKRIVYAIDDDNRKAHIYYTDDHYNTFHEIKFD